MMQLWDKRNCRPVYTTCIQPHTSFKRKKSHLKVYSTADYEAMQELIGFGLTAAAVIGWVLVGILFVRWWLG